MIEEPARESRWVARAIFAIALAYALFHVRTGITGPLGGIIQGSIHLGFAFVLCFLLHPGIIDPRRGGWANVVSTFVAGGLAGTILLAIVLEAARIWLGLEQPIVPGGAWYFIGPAVAVLLHLASRRFVIGGSILPGDMALEIIAVVGAVYTIAHYERIVTYSAPATTMDYLMSASLLLLVLEVGRRAVGWPLVMVSASFLVYALFGQHIPGLWGHPGFSITTLLYSLYMAQTGILGPLIRISSTLIAIVVVFGGVLIITGVGQSFIDMALAMAGRSKGGPAKAAVIASSLFGTITGSATANVAIVGTLTIPLMKSRGYEPGFAAGVEATASTGGQIMPPIMASAAFLMAELLGVPYVKIMFAAFLPAVAYYLACFLTIHLLASKGNLPGMPSEEIKPLRKVLFKPEVGSFFASLGALVVLLVLGFPVTTAVFWAIVAVMVVHALPRFFHRHWSAVLDLVRGLESGGRMVVGIAAIIALAQLISSLVGISGLGVKFAQLIATLGEQDLLYSLLVTAALALILGCGMPPAAAYILCVSVAVPGLLRLGVPALVAHMYVFYFTAMATITPPVAAAVFVAARLANTSWVTTTNWALRLGFAGLLVPLVFAYRPGLLLMGDASGILYAALIVCLGIASWSFTISGFATRSLRIYERVIFFVGGALLFTPGGITDVIGLSILVVTYLWQRFLRTRIWPEKVT